MFLQEVSMFGHQEDVNPDSFVKVFGFDFDDAGMYWENVFSEL